MLKRALILLVLLCLLPSAAWSDHYDQCAGISSDTGDDADCFQNADRVLENFVAANPDLFSAERIVQNFIDNTKIWSGEIVRIATALFWSLALFEFILTFSMMAVRGSDLNEFTVEFLKRALIISFGLFLLENHLALEQIIQGFRDSSSLVREGQIGKEYALRDLMGIPLEVVGNMLESVKPLNFVTDAPEILMILFTAVIVLWALSVAAVQLVLVLCEMYIVMAVGLLSLGLFSLQITREYPMRFFGGLIGTGFKLFALELIIALGIRMVEGWATMPVMHKVGPYMLMAGAAIMYKEIAVRIPNYIQGLLTASPGSGVSAAGAVTAAGTVAAAHATGAAVAGRSAAGGVTSVREAVGLARSQGANGPGEMSRGIARNLVGSWADNLADKSPVARQLRKNRMRSELGNKTVRDHD